MFHPYVPGTLFSLAQGAIQLSSDGGATWRKVDLGLPSGASAGTLAFDPLMPDTWWAPIGTSGLWKTVTGGD